MTTDRRRTASADAARPGLGPDAAADALPAVLRACTATRSRTPGPSRRSTSPTTSPTCDRKLTAGRAAPGPAAGRVLRHRRLDRREQPGAQPLQAHQRARGAAVPVAPAVRGGAARPVLPDPARHLPARPRRSAPRRSRRSRTSRRSGARPSSASSGSTRSATLDELRDARATARQFLLNLICFAACIEGLFFFGAFAYVYFLRSRGPAQRPGRRAPTGCSATRAMHMAFAFEVVDTVRARGARAVRRRARRSRSREMIDEAVECETQFAEDLLRRGRAGHVAGRHARSTSSTSPTSACDRSACRTRLRLEEPVRVHGAAGRAGAVELLRAPRLGLPGRRRRRRRLRRRLLTRSRELLAHPRAQEVHENAAHQRRAVSERPSLMRPARISSRRRGHGTHSTRSASSGSDGSPTYSALEAR